MHVLGVLELYLGRVFVAWLSKSLPGTRAGLWCELVVNFAPFRQQRFRFQLFVSPCPLQAETKCLETQGRVHSTVTNLRSASKDSHNANESNAFVLKHPAHACAVSCRRCAFQTCLSPPPPRAQRGRAKAKAVAQLRSGTRGGSVM